MLPAATSLKKQGANKGATTAFLITTPESGVDSITVTYALLDPIMTVMRPLAAFISGISAGVLENSLYWKKETAPIDLLSRQVEQVEPESKRKNPIQKIYEGLRYGFVDVWADIVVWFGIGLLIAGTITALIPDEFLAKWLGGGIVSMFMMLVAGIPLYICATASTPIAAALILKGVSPGAALVFLLVGPATNITSLTVLFNLLGRKSTFRYLIVISVVAVLFGLGVDGVYNLLNIEPRAIIGEAGEIVPQWVKLAGTIVLMVFSIKPLYRQIRAKFCPSPDTQLQSGIQSMDEIGKHNSCSDHNHSGSCGCG